MLIRSTQVVLKASLQAVLFQNYFLIMRMLRFSWHSQDMPYIERKWEKMKGKRGNGEKWRIGEGWNLSLSPLPPSLHFISLSPFPFLHSPSISSFSPHFLAARLPGWRRLWQPGTTYMMSLKVSLDTQATLFWENILRKNLFCSEAGLPAERGEHLVLGRLLGRLVLHRLHAWLPPHTPVFGIEMISKAAFWIWAQTSSLKNFQTNPFLLKPFSIIYRPSCSNKTARATVVL